MCLVESNHPVRRVCGCRRFSGIPVLTRYEGKIPHRPLMCKTAHIRYPLGASRLGSRIAKCTLLRAFVGIELHPQFEDFLRGEIQNLGFGHACLDLSEKTV